MSESHVVEGVELTIAPIKATIEDLRVAVERHVIQDDPSLAAAADMLGRVKAHIKTIEDARTAIVKPINDSVKTINKIFAVPASTAEAIKDILSRKIIAYQTEQERIAAAAEKVRRDAETARLQAEADKRVELAVVTGSEVELDKAIQVEETIAAVQAAPLPFVSTVRTSASTTSMRKSWAYEIVDALAVPRWYCKPDHDLIMAAIRGGDREINGVRIFEKSSLVSK